MRKRILNFTIPLTAVLLLSMFTFSESAEKDKTNLNIKLIEASENDDLKRVKHLLDSGADVNATNIFKQTALTAAASFSYWDIVKVLLERKANINFQNGEYGMSALMYASESGDEEIAKFLIERGADVNLKDNWDFTALMRASKGGYDKIVRLLLKHGADPHAKNEDGDTALDLATRRNYQMIVDILQQYKK